MESAVDFPTIRKYFSSFFTHVPGVTQASFVDSGKDSTLATTAAVDLGDTPFVLVAHGASGQWEVYARDFEHPLAAFAERQAGCDFASALARNRQDAIVLIRDSQALQ